MDEKMLEKVKNSVRAIAVFRDNQRFLIVPNCYDPPFVFETGYFIVESVNSSNHDLGVQLLYAFKYVEDNIGMENTSTMKKAWKLEKKYKNWHTFVRNNVHANIGLNKTEGFYGIGTWGKNKAETDFEVNLYNARIEAPITPEQLGRMVVEAFDRTEEIYKARLVEDMETVDRNTIELLSSEKVSYEVPVDEHFVDAEDYHTGEIYQGYSYCPKDNEEPVAEFYFSMSPNADCNIEKESVLAAWEKYHGKADCFDYKKVRHPVFKRRAEFTNEKVHLISYFWEGDDEDVLECAFELKKPGVRKKLDKTLTKEFESFVKSCDWVKS